jgi:hypothetical protein
VGLTILDPLVGEVRDDIDKFAAAAQARKDPVVGVSLAEHDPRSRRVPEPPHFRISLELRGVQEKTEGRDTTGRRRFNVAQDTRAER